MKRNVQVTMTFDVELDVDDKCFTEEFYKDFSGYMSYVDCPEDIFQHIAYHFAQQTDPSFVEGIGEATWKRSSFAKESTIKYDVSNLEVEMEVKDNV